MLVIVVSYLGIMYGKKDINHLIKLLKYAISKACANGVIIHCVALLHKKNLYSRACNGGVETGWVLWGAQKKPDFPTGKIRSCLGQLGRCYQPSVK